MQSHPLNSKTRINKHRRTVERLALRRQTTNNRFNQQSGGPSAEQVEVLSQGTVIGGKFRIISLIGMGGMGIVYLAEHIALKRRYALKILAPDLVNEQNWLRFKSEAKILASLNHPTLVNVYDLGIHRDSVPFYAMDYLEGFTIEDLLCDAQPLTVEQTLDIFLVVLDGLAYAHRNGVIHRDIKPGNILLQNTAQGVGPVKILDFGISKLLDSNQSEQYLTNIGEIFGSPYYMSPEQCAGAVVDSKADIYSVGCAMFETLTGYVPFDGETPLDTALMHQEDDVPLLAEVCDEKQFPQSLDFVIGKCMAKAPHDRYKSAKELALDLSRIKEGKDVLAYSSDYAATKSGKRTGGRSGKRQPAKASKGTNALMIMSVLAMAVGGLTCFLWLNVVHEMRSIKDSKLSKAAGNDLNRLPSFPEPENAEVGRQMPRFKSGADMKEMGLGRLEGMLNNSSDIMISFNQLPKKAPPSIKITTPYSSFQTEKGERFRVFDFPSDVFLGCLYGDDVGDSARAQGPVKLSDSDQLTYCPSRTATHFPQYLQRFRSGDIRAIKLLSFANDNDMLTAITVVPGVQVVRLASCKNIDARGLRALALMPQLQRLDVSDTQIEGAALASARNWSSLQSLVYGSGNKVGPMLAVLGKSHQFVNLDLNHAKLSDNDYRLLSEMSGLVDLNLSFTQTTPAHLKVLSRLKSLQSINLEGCPFSQHAIFALRDFKSLKSVSLGLTELPELSKGPKLELPGVDIH